MLLIRCSRAIWEVEGSASDIAISECTARSKAVANQNF